MVQVKQDEEAKADQRAKEFVQNLKLQISNMAKEDTVEMKGELLNFITYCLCLTSTSTRVGWIGSYFGQHGTNSRANEQFQRLKTKEVHCVFLKYAQIDVIYMPFFVNQVHWNLLALFRGESEGRMFSKAY